MCVCLCVDITSYRTVLPNWIFSRIFNSIICILPLWCIHSPKISRSPKRQHFHTVFSPLYHEKWHKYRIYYSIFFSEAFYHVCMCFCIRSECRDLKHEILLWFNWFHTIFRATMVFEPAFEPVSVAPAPQPTFRNFLINIHSAHIYIFQSLVLCENLLWQIYTWNSWAMGMRIR